MKTFSFFSVIFFVFSVVSIAQPSQLKNFDELMANLKTGHSVRGVYYYAKCKLIADSVEEKSPEAIGGQTVSTFEYFARLSVKNPKAFVTFSDNILISHRKWGFVYNYVKVKVYEDNSVEINARYLTTSTMMSVMNETFYGKINDGSNEGGIFFYADK